MPLRNKTILVILTPLSPQFFGNLFFPIVSKFASFLYPQHFSSSLMTLVQVTKISILLAKPLSFMVPFLMCGEGAHPRSSPKSPNLYEQILFQNGKLLAMNPLSGPENGCSFFIEQNSKEGYHIIPYLGT